MCLKKFSEDEIKVAIDTDFRQQIFELLQNELDASQLYTQVACESCLEIITKFAAWKSQFIENQRILEDALIFENTIVDETAMLESSHLEAHCFTIKEEHLEIGSDFEVTNQGSLKSQSNKQKKKHIKLCADCGKTYSTQAYKRHFERVHLKLKNYHVSPIVLLDIK